MTARNDVSRPDWVVAQALPAAGNVLLTRNRTAEAVSALPFAFQDMMGLNNLSITFSTRTGSTAVGSLTLECTDFPQGEQVYGVATSTQWAAMNYPNTATPITIAVATGQNTYNIQLSNTGCKYIRVRYTATSGTGTLDAAISCRANSRS